MSDQDAVTPADDAVTIIKANALAAHIRQLTESLVDIPESDHYRRGAVKQLLQEQLWRLHGPAPLWGDEHHARKAT